MAKFLEHVKSYIRATNVGYLAALLCLLVITESFRFTTKSFRLITRCLSRFMRMLDLQTNELFIFKGIVLIDKIKLITKMSANKI